VKGNLALSWWLSVSEHGLVMGTVGDRYNSFCLTVFTGISAAALIKFFAPQILDATKKSFLLISRFIFYLCENFTVTNRSVF